LKLPLKQQDNLHYPPPPPRASTTRCCAESNEQGLLYWRPSPIILPLTSCRRPGCQSCDQWWSAAAWPAAGAGARVPRQSSSCSGWSPGPPARTPCLQDHTQLCRMQRCRSNLSLNRSVVWYNPHPVHDSRAEHFCFVGRMVDSPVSDTFNTKRRGARGEGGGGEGCQQHLSIGV